MFTGAKVMDDFTETLFSNATLSKNQNIHVGWRYLDRRF
jgi:hypothetical protein